MTARIGFEATAEALRDYVRSHIEQEHEIVSAYKELADHDTRALGYLARLIVEDEERHHRLLSELAESIERSADFAAEEGAMPTLRALAIDRDAGLATTERFLEIEKRDLSEVKELERRVADLGDTTLWPLVLRLIRDDTEKHIRILEFVRDRLRHGRDHR